MIVEKKEFNENEERWIECIYDSSNILKSVYLPKLKRLYISFNRGGVYSYNNIDDTLYNEFEVAKSQGKFFAKHIKKHPDKYPHRKEFSLFPSEIEQAKKIIEEKKQNDEE